MKYFSLGFFSGFLTAMTLGLAQANPTVKMLEKDKATAQLGYLIGFIFGLITLIGALIWFCNA